MKNPNSASGAGAFRVTSTATLNSTIDATTPLPRPTPNEQRFRWCGLSNSVQPISMSKGRITYV
jgi:hypothetical protein